jgi:hypothetical protein
MRLPNLSPLGSAALVLLAAPGKGASSVRSEDWASATAQLAAYPLAECVVCQTDLARGTTNYLHGDRLIRVCSYECWETFGAGPAWYLERIDRALFEQQRARYPLAGCAVCGQALDAAAGAIDHVRGARLARLCGEDCLVRFLTDPGPAMAAVDAAWIGAQRTSYPTAICPVMETEVEALGTPVEMLHGIRLVRLCCDSCVETFREDPATWLARLDELAAAGAPAGNGR